MKEAVSVLKKSGCILYPTDTVYGLGANALSKKAIKNVYKIKGRSFKSPISIAVSSFKMLEKYTKLKPDDKKIILRFKKNGLFPGPTTLLLKKKGLPSILTNGSLLVGVRIPINEKCLKIIRSFGKPITSTSANLSGDVSAKSLKSVNPVIKKLVDFQIDGRCVYKKESTIIDLENRKIVRKGACWRQAQRLLR